MSGTPPAAKAEQMAAGQPRIPLTLPESFMIGGLAGCAAVTVSEYQRRARDSPLAPFGLFVGSSREAAVAEFRVR